MGFQQFETRLKESPVKTCIVEHENERLYEYSQSDSMRKQVQRVNSITKSVLSILYGIALKRGDINSLQTSIVSYFPEVSKIDPKKEKITLHDLLTMRSGIDWPGNEGMRSSNNWIEYILHRPMRQSPGEVMKYACGNSHLLSAILQKQTGMKTSIYAEEHLFSPLNITEYEWDEDPQGVITGGFGLYLKTEDLLKIGQLYLNKGTWNGLEIVSKDWVDESTKPYTDTNVGNQQYCYHWWYSPSGSNDQPAFYYAAGNGGQYIFIVPEKQLVTVFTSDFERKESIKPFQWFVRFVLNKV
ncbi:beta-lactamase family protein [Bacillus shivajii]|uniref:serine hydrolase domain-containing protein n=1 Tax=Bacillus shivajii TaxID=1983719 RepID=UPI001CF938EB|nr:serine hydrolase [Bacillus shivajii]UCZ55150.1 beta-lactamase family protein [Bacillus shivajii]